MRDSETIMINMPVSLRGTFEAAVARQCISVHEAARRLILGLSGLTDADLQSLSEPPREHRNRDLAITLEWKYLDQLLEVSRISRLSYSSIFRRILNALLITRQIHFVSRENGNRFRLMMAEINIEFVDEFQCDGPIPLLSRQHRD